MAFEDFFNLGAMGLQRMQAVPPASPPPPVTANMLKQRQQQPLIDPRPGSPFGNVFTPGAGFQPNRPVIQAPASPMIGAAMSRMGSTGSQFKSYGGGLSRVGPKPVSNTYTAELMAKNGQVWENV